MSGTASLALGTVVHQHWSLVKRHLVRGAGNFKVLQVKKRGTSPAPLSAAFLLEFVWKGR